MKSTFCGTRGAPTIVGTAPEWTERQARITHRTLALAVVLLVVSVGVGACALMPSGSPSLEAAPSSSLLGGQSCVRDQQEGNPLLVGWLAGKLAAIFRAGPCIFDPANSDWIAFGPRSAGRFVTDGSGLGGSPKPGVLTVVTPDERAIDITLPVSASDWASRGSQISPLVGGGYVLGLLPSLVRVSGAGALSEAAIPSGFVLAAPTSNPEVFLLRPNFNTDVPDWNRAPYTAFLWKVGDKKPSPLLGSVVDISAARAPVLTWLEDISGAWWHVPAIGAPTKELRAAPLWLDEPSPTGEYVVGQTDRSQGCEHDTPPSCSVRLIERATGNVVALANVGSNSSFAWSENSVAFIPTTSDPVAQPTSMQIIVLSPGGVSLTALPLPR
jgi:hypothetical protein